MTARRLPKHATIAQLGAQEAAGRWVGAQPSLLAAWQHNGCILPIEQKAPAWSADGKSVAFLEGIEEVYMTFATKGQPPSSTDRDALIMSTWQVYVVDVDTGARRYAGRGDDPAWSPDNRLSRAYPDPSDQGPIVIIETAPYPDGTNWEELRVIPHPKTRGWGRMAWRGRSG